jgi:hypothetical protein
MHIDLYEELTSMGLDEAINHFKKILNEFELTTDSINISEYEFNDLVKNGFLIGNQGNCIVQNFYAMIVCLYNYGLFEPNTELKMTLDQLTPSNYIIKFKLFHYQYLKRFLQMIDYTVKLTKDRITELLVQHSDICFELNKQILGLPINEINLTHEHKFGMINVGQLGSHSFYFLCLNSSINDKQNYTKNKFIVFDDIGIRNYLLPTLSKQFNYPKFKYEIMPIPILNQIEFDQFIQNYTDEAIYGSFIGGCVENIVLLIVLIVFGLVFLICFIVVVIRAIIRID